MSGSSRALSEWSALVDPTRVLLCFRGGQGPPSCPAVPLALALGSFVWEAGTEKQSSIFYQSMNIFIFLEKGERVEQPEELTGEVKARNERLSWAMLGGTGRAPFLPTGLSL